MATIPPIRKLYIEDYATQKGWIGPFLITLNTFMTSVVSALSMQLTIAANTTSDIKYITLSASPSASAPASVAWTKNAIPVSVILGNVLLTSGADFTLSAAAGIQWKMSSDNKTIQITNVLGITPSATSQYILTLICIAG